MESAQTTGKLIKQIKRAIVPGFSVEPGASKRKNDIIAGKSPRTPARPNTIVVTIRNVGVDFDFTVARLERGNLQPPGMRVHHSIKTRPDTRARGRSILADWAKRWTGLESPSLKNIFSIFFASLVLLPAWANARDTHEQGRIDFLLQSVETAKGVVFIRNGSEYGGPAAAQHLRQKLNYGGERLKTAENFIQYCATESSFSHRKYHVRTSDGATKEAAEYFGGLLREYDRTHPKTSEEKNNAR